MHNFAAGRIPASVSLLLLLGAASCAPAETHWNPPPEVDPSDPSTLPEPAVITAAVPPPAISGGTMIFTHAGVAVAADPDRDCVWVVSPGSSGNPGKLLGKIDLPAGSEPGRLAEDAAGRVHVALRGGGSLATLDVGALTVTATRPVCASPRGVAYDAAADTMLVACARGDLVTLPAAGGVETRRVYVDDDLRDVVLDGAQLWVSRFRSAELLQLKADGTIALRLSPQIPEGSTKAPAVAWKTIGLPGGGVAMLHQLAETGVVGANGGGAEYYSSIIDTAVAFVRTQAGSAQPVLLDETQGFFGVTLAVDLAVSPDGQTFAVAAAGSATVYTVTGSQGAWYQNTQIPCSEAACQPTAVAFDAQGNTLVQSRETAAVAGVSLDAPSRADTGHDIFHLQPSGSFNDLACASCHPEGGEDGRVWRFLKSGHRRTESLGGGVLATAPFHWSGDLRNMSALMDEVFVGRMGADPVGPKHIDVLGRWLDALPRPATRANFATEAADRGAKLFADTAVGCASCHSGKQLTNNQTVDVGTGGKFQVPRLTGLSARAPYMHNGCAKTLHDRFSTKCGGGEAHGHTAQLTGAQLDDLVAYLHTL
jgi:DNA-binding beta-propeller fold protein YncE/mono/diheme cytochrome c family protein